jgi:metal-responsive CopG/Arc/MetJ family transcriptional regulator
MTSPGRPPKPDGKKRQPLHISLYAEDLERLEQLTDNRSEFIRGCIERAWEEKHGEQVTLTLTLPKWLIEDLLKTLTEQLSPQQASLVRQLVRGLVANAAVSNANGASGNG